MKLKRPFKILFQILIILIAIFIAWVWNYTTIFVNDSKAPEGYLPIKDYFLRNYETGRQPSTRSLYFRDQYTDYSEYTNPLETSFGLRPEASWQEFVSLYGPYNLDYISCFYMDGKSSQHQYVEGPITVNDFDKEYIQTNQIDLEKYSLDLCFSIQVWGSSVQYTDDEKYQARDSFYSHSIWLGDYHFSFFQPKIQSLSMYLSFVPSGIYPSFEQGGLMSICVYKYNY